MRMSPKHLGMEHVGVMFHYLFERPVVHHLIRKLGTDRNAFVPQLATFENPFLAWTSSDFIGYSHPESQMVLFFSAPDVWLPPPRERRDKTNLLASTYIPE